MDILPEVLKIRTPQTALPVLPAIKKRFSPRVFSSDPVPAKDLAIIFEAARLAPSGRNHQPWLFYISNRGTPEYDRLFTCIPERNHWANTAPVIIVACYIPKDPKEGLNRWALFDLGASVISLILQATELDYYARQIGSFNWEKTKSEFGFPEDYLPFSLVALGKIGTESDYAKAAPDIIAKEIAPNLRKSGIYFSLADSHLPLS